MPTISDYQKEVDLKRKVLYKPCETASELKSWLKLFLNIELIDHHVDAESTSSPFEMVWEIYKNARSGKQPYRSVVSYANRAGGKTLSSAIIELLFLLHLKRDVVHGAALKDQSDKCKEYIEGFLAMPVIIEASMTKNSKELSIGRYAHYSTGKEITPKMWEALDGSKKSEYMFEVNKIRIVVATVESTNGQHAPLLTLDELDLIDNNVIREAKRIPTSPRTGGRPLSFYTSTRKSSVGPVQKMIDEAEKTNTRVLHWNIIDTTESCEPERHLPAQPMVDLYVNRDQFLTISQQDFDDLPLPEQDKFTKHKGYAGCVKCPIFAGCLGRLATEQKSTHTKMLKEIDSTIDEIKDADLDIIKSQLMCWEPSKSGLIYPRFDKAKHVISAQRMATMITGNHYEDKMTQQELIRMLMRLPNAQSMFFAGMDHGYTDPFSVVSGVVVGNYLFVFDVIYLLRVELNDRMRYCKNRLVWEPVIFSDTASADANEAFSKYGFRLMNWSKGEINIGIESVRNKLFPAPDEPPEVYILEGDACAPLVTEFQGYSWKVDAAGNTLDVPAPHQADHALDALRYLIINLFLSNGQMKMRLPKAGDYNAPEEYKPQSADEVISETLKELTHDLVREGDGGIIKKKGFKATF